MTDQAKAAAAGDLAGLVDAALSGQMAGLQLLLGEMQALAGVMPGLAAPATRSEEELKAIDAEVEMSFDNMPV